ncbi:hypothetical protein ACH4Y0_21045 [Streptomyces sp. NPDC020707]|uniref:hypothetical protein n=1 Tax=Streptomyces sp. NPDC020707 TaxID=3365084 RepID=UPI00378C8D74
MAVDPDRAALQAFGTRGPEGLFVMLGLPRITPGGQASYEEYSRRAAAILRQYGGGLLHAGDGDTSLVAEAGQAWDAVPPVRFISREADFIRPPLASSMPAVSSTSSHANFRKDTPTSRPARHVRLVATPEHRHGCRTPGFTDR